MQEGMLPLPDIPQGDTQSQLLAIRRYLFRLVEQLQYLLDAGEQTREQDRQSCSPQAYAQIEQQLQNSETVARTFLGSAQRHISGKYIPTREFDLAMARLEQEEGRLNQSLCTREDTEQSGGLPRWELVVAGTPGIAVREGEEVSFSPLPGEEAQLLHLAPDGRWRL